MNTFSPAMRLVFLSRFPRSILKRRGTYGRDPRRYTDRSRSVHVTGPRPFPSSGSRPTAMGRRGTLPFSGRDEGRGTGPQQAQGRDPVARTSSSRIGPISEIRPIEACFEFGDTGIDRVVPFLPDAGGRGGERGSCGGGSIRSRIIRHPHPCSDHNASVPAQRTTASAPLAPTRKSREETSIPPSPRGTRAR